VLGTQRVNDKDGSYLNIAWFGDDFKSNIINEMIMNLKSFNYDIEADNNQF
jgi:hypothetical protein